MSDIIISDAMRGRAESVAAGLRTLAGLLDERPEMAEYVLPRFGQHLFDEPREKFAAFAPAALAAGAHVAKTYHDNYAHVTASWGPVVVDLQTDRSEVCELVVTGTETITEEVPDPEILATVPTITVTRVQDTTEWRCRPLLADDADSRQDATAGAA